jgi:anti-sigma factor RsiW
MSACEQLDTLLSDWIDGTLPPERRSTVDAHLAACPDCRALADDLTAIARDAAALPPIQPSRDLWAGIAQRIEAPVVPLGVTGERAIAHRRLYVSRRWLSAAAAALVVGSVGATYAVMRATAPSAPGAPVVAAAPAPTAVPAVVVPSSAPESVAAPVQSPALPATAPTARLASSRPEETAAAGVTTYDTEIRSLRAVLRRRTDLDSSTVAVIERSLRVIDDAIAQSRTALARDPHSRLLGDQLTRALDQKVELLRTAILLPASS